MPRERKTKTTKNQAKPYKTPKKKDSKIETTIEPAAQEKLRGESIRAIISPSTILNVTANDSGIFITDRELNSLHILDRDGAYKSTIGGKGRKNTCYNKPTGVTALSDGTIVVADSLNERLKFIVDPAGKHEVSVPLSGMPCLQSICMYKEQIYCTFANMIRVFMKKKNTFEAGRQFVIMEMDEDCETTGLAVNDIAIYISDMKAGKVCQIQKEAVWKSLNKLYHEKIEPAGLAVDGDGNLFVCNQAKNNILVFDSMMQTCSSQIKVNGKPRDLAFLDEKRLIVTYDAAEGAPFEILTLA